MGVKTLIIKKLWRLPSSVSEDEIIFDRGVNVLVGEKDTGKTVWLRMLDFLLGSDKKAKDALDSKIEDKYDSISALIEIGDEEVSIERRWKEKGSARKIFVNDEPIPHEEFSENFLKRLNIPILHFPKGDPFSEKTWPQLSFRTLLRHIYRREEFWHEFADKQYESEQHASLSLFLGIADKLFPPEYEDLIRKQKRVAVLQEMKDQFINMLQEVSKELVVSKDLSVGFTGESIDSAKKRLNKQIEELYGKREDVLEELKKETLKEYVEHPSGLRKDEVDKIGERIVQLRQQKEQLKLNLAELEKRLAELRGYYQIVENEEARMKRAQRAGDILGQLKTTCCPVCDQNVDDIIADAEVCYLCSRPYIQNEEAIVGGKARVEFDLRQLGAERRELKQLIEKLHTEEKRSIDTIRDIETEVQRLRRRLRPISIAIAAIIPEEFGLIDQEIGGLQEQILQLERIKGALKRRTDLSAQITEIEKETSIIQAELKKLRGEIDFETAGDILSDGMNSYLNALNVEDPNRWKKGPVSFRIKSRDFNAFVSGSLWSAELGATSKVLFLLSYHYSLLGLPGLGPFFYPGLLILDFPVQLADGSSIADKENYLIEPFVQLLNRPEMEKTQLIAAGRAFAGLKGVNRIELRHVWKRN
jgi:predicted  nucleic acid-binding Zn-ribbon protein